MARVTGLSVLIRAKNEALALPATLAAIARQRIDLPVEVVVVDSGSTDATVQVARAGGARVVPLGHEYCPGLAVNVGMRSAREEIVVIISAAAFPADREWLAGLVKPLLVDRDLRLGGTFGRYVPVPGVSPIEEPLLDRIFSDTGTGAPFSFTNAAIRRVAWERHPCNEAIASGGGDDREWHARIVHAGYEVLYVPGSVVHRSHGLTAAGWYSRMTADAATDRIIARSGGTVVAPGGSRGSLVVPTLAHLVRGHRWADLARCPLVVASIAAGRWAGSRRTPPRGINRMMPAVGRLDDRLFSVRERARRETEAFLRDYWASAPATARGGGAAGP